MISGGVGAAYLGIGAHEQYRKDVVTVSLRLVSTLTSEILLSSTVSKTINSTSLGSDVFKAIANTGLKNKKPNKSNPSNLFNNLNIYRFLIL